MTPFGWGLAASFPREIGGFLLTIRTLDRKGVAPFITL
jgi:hypothetical protein